MKSDDSWHPPPDFYRYAFGAMVWYVFAAAMLVVGTILVTSCLPVAGGGCLYPYGAFGVFVFLFAFALLGAGTWALVRVFAWIPSALLPAWRPSSRAPRKPDSPPPRTLEGRVLRGLGARSWLDDLPDMSPPDPASANGTGRPAEVPSHGN